jgi:glycosyltransferase involved in cell wall biosynthesis
MLSSKAVITCSDSGGPLEFVVDGETGLVAEATPESIALSMDYLWANRGVACELGRAARNRYTALNISWEQAVEKLTC